MWMLLRTWMLHRKLHQVQNAAETLDLACKLHRIAPAEDPRTRSQNFLEKSYTDPKQE